MVASIRITKKMPYRPAYSQIWWRHFLNWSSFLSDDYSLLVSSQHKISQHNREDLYPEIMLPLRSKTKKEPCMRKFRDESVQRSWAKINVRCWKPSVGDSDNSLILNKTYTWKHFDSVQKNLIYYNGKETQSAYHLPSEKRRLICQKELSGEQLFKGKMVEEEIEVDHCRANRNHENSQPSQQHVRVNLYCQLDRLADQWRTPLGVMWGFFQRQLDHENSKHSVLE